MVLRSAGMRRYGDLRRVLLGVLADTPGEKLDGHDAERGVATLARPLGVGQCLEEPRELLVLGDDRLQEVSGLLAADEARTPKALLVEVGEEGSLLVEEPPDSEPVDVDDDVARFQRRPLAFPGRLRE